MGGSTGRSSSRCFEGPWIGTWDCISANGDWDDGRSGTGNPGGSQRRFSMAPMFVCQEVMMACPEDLSSRQGASKRNQDDHERYDQCSPSAVCGHGFGRSKTEEDSWESKAVQGCFLFDKNCWRSRSRQPGGRGSPLPDLYLLSKVKVNRYKCYGYHMKISLAKGPNDRSGVLRNFFRRFGSQGQCVKPALEFIRKRSIHHPVALEGVLWDRS